MNEREVFAEAMALDSAAERANFLEKACGGDQNFRKRMEDLLHDQLSLGSFLESPPPGVAETSSSAEIAERTGSDIGRYKLLQKLGEGGMGVVYMAEQREPVERRVALKIIKPGMDTDQVIARFEAERQALAMMDHQNIARVLDAGATDTGRSYFVMELVKGVTITDYCNHNKLTPRERVELFLPVCQAIQHAHQKGIIHRDIKPSNIMVTHYDGKPVPKIIDFGVAKATAQRLTEKTMFTLYGQIVGTLEYMSPEQAEMSALDIDTRSDIYSLGVVLYELLTGSPPLSMKQLREATLPEMLRMIREHETEPPSTWLSHSGDSLLAISAQRRTDPQRLSALIRGELDWIVLKALEKDRTRRYESASGLARDIERYLADEPVEACPPSTVYRLRKQLRKHRGLVTAASAIVTSLMIGLVVSLTMYLRAATSSQQADIAREAEAQKSEELREALASRDEALGERIQAMQKMDIVLQEREAALRRSEASRLAALSSSTLPTDPGLALVLAVESARRDTARTAMQNNVLFAALAQNRETRTLFVGETGSKTSTDRFNVTVATFSDDGSRIITLAEGAQRRENNLDKNATTLHVGVGMAQVWDASGELLSTVIAPPNQKFAAVDVSPDGRLLVGRFENSSLVSYGTSSDKDNWQACLYSSRVARVWDLESGKETHVLRGHTDRLTAVHFSPDGTRILTSSADGTLRVWDTVTGDQLKLIEPKANAIADAFFTPGGRILATLPGAIWTTRFVDGEGSGYTVDVADPPFDPRHSFVKVDDGERGRASRAFSFTGTLGLPLPGQVPLGDTGDAAIRLWDSETFEEISLDAHFFDKKLRTVDSVHFASDPARAILATNTGLVYIVSLEDGKLTSTVETGLASIKATSLSHDGQRLLALGRAGAIAVIQLTDGAIVRTWDAAEGTFQFACFGSTSNHIFAARALLPATSNVEATQYKVAILDIPTGKEVGCLNGHNGVVNSLRLGPTGSHLVTASVDGTARIWRADLQPSNAKVFPGFGPMRQATFTPDGKRILVTTGSPKDFDDWMGFGAIFDAASGKRLTVLASEKYLPESVLVRHGIGGVSFAQFSTDGKRVLTISDDRHVRMIDPNTSDAALFALPQEQWPVTEHLPFTPARVWDARTGRELFALEGLQLSVAWATFSPDGRRIVTLSRRRSSTTDLQVEDGEAKVLGSGGGLVNDEELAQIHVWDGQTGKLIMTLRDLLNPHIDLSDDGNTPLAISPDGKWLAITELNGVVDLHASKRYSMPGIWSGSTPLFSPDGRYLLTHTRRDATVLDLQRLNSAKGHSGGEMEVCQYDSDGKALRNNIPMAQSHSYELVTVGGHADNILSASFSSDSRWFATTSADRTVRIWSAATGKLQHELQGHPGPVLQAAFSPDGKYIATRSTDWLVRVFLADSGREFVTLSGHRGPINSLVFNSDGRFILTASDDGTSRLWQVDPLPAAIEHKPRDLTGDESARYEIPSAVTRD